MRVRVISLGHLTHGEEVQLPVIRVRVRVISLGHLTRGEEVLLPVITVRVRVISLGHLTRGEEVLLPVMPVVLLLFESYLTNNNMPYDSLSCLNMAEHALKWLNMPHGNNYIHDQ